jgi:hypothetical protein
VVILAVNSQGLEWRFATHDGRQNKPQPDRKYAAFEHRQVSFADFFLRTAVGCQLR